VIIPNDLWYLWHFPTGSTILPAFLAFDFSDPSMRFLPYWSNSNVVKFAPEKEGKILLTIFAKKKSALVMVSNLGEETAGELSLDAQALFAHAGSVRWQEADSSLPAPEQRVKPPSQLPKVQELDSPAQGDAGEKIADLFDAGSDKGKLELQAEGSKVHLTVRRHDYRLLRVDLE